MADTKAAHNLMDGRALNQNGQYTIYNYGQVWLYFCVENLTTTNKKDLDHLLTGVLTGNKHMFDSLGPKFEHFRKLCVHFSFGVDFLSSQLVSALAEDPISDAP
jgi:hypothetical protein